MFKSHCEVDDQSENFKKGENLPYYTDIPCHGKYVQDLCFEQNFGQLDSDDAKMEFPLYDEDKDFLKTFPTLKFVQQLNGQYQKMKWKPREYFEFNAETS